MLSFVEMEFPEAPRVRRPAVMSLHGLLAPTRVLLGVRASALDDVLDLAASRLAPVWPGTSAAALAAALRAREASASTAVGAGLAIPHTAHPGAPTSAALLTLRTPLGAGPDGAPVTTVLVLAGVGAGGLPLVARAAALARGDLCQRLERATTVEEALGAFQSAERWSGGDELG